MSLVRFAAQAPENLPAHGLVCALVYLLQREVPSRDRQWLENRGGSGGCLEPARGNSPCNRIVMKVFLELGGPMLKIFVKGKIIEFEMHPYCGPNILNKRGEPLANQPVDFLKAASLWAQQGKRMENGLCRWDHEPELITKHLGGRHYLLIGEKPPKRGF